MAIMAKNQVFTQNFQVKTASYKLNDNYFRK
jgi:hypothetical protein